MPVAAEVLESRALLSAGAAAVHAASQHAAALHSTNHHSTQTTNPSFQATAILAENTPGGLPSYFGASLSVASFSPHASANVSANFKHSIKFGNSADSTTGAFKGKITAVNSLGGNSFEFDVQPVGSLTLSLAGQKFTAVPDGTPLKLYYFGEFFQELKVDVVFPPGTGGGFANVHLNFDITLSL